jgi:hypothetical protein
MKLPKPIIMVAAVRAIVMSSYNNSNSNTV